MSAFLDRLSRARKEKMSRLCVGLDPASIFFRDRGGIPKDYFEKNNEVKGMLKFCLDIIEKTSPHAAAFKLNSQYSIPFGGDELQQIADKIEEKGCVGIYDLKLSDIGSTNESAVYWMKKLGFQAFTFSPFAGNVEEATRAAHNANLGIIVLALMSNPTARYFMRDAVVDNSKGYEWVAKQVAHYNSDGIVVGATNPSDEMRNIRSLIGSDKTILVPGIGEQQGDLEAVKQNLGDNILVNVGRAIIYSEDAGEESKKYQKLIG